MKTKFGKFMVTLLAMAAIVLGGFSYYFYDLNKKAETKNAGLSFRIDKLEKEKVLIAKQLEEKIKSISKDKEVEIDKLKGTYDELVGDMKTEIELGQIKITQLVDRLSVSMVDKILFPSGRAEITPEGLKILERVGKVLKNTKDKIIRVEGHTDNVPILSGSKLKEIYPTNWELSSARATNVVRFLQEKVEIEPTRLRPVGMSEYHPVASNETPEGNSQNRRIEITLIPGPSARTSETEK
ncbi:MAG: flagellar motor protein MotB [Deltaproteobacteria bacterium]|nr:flagellar motor protein MotB [Deltaproteobacteria bacterium]MBW2365533.1 flagellar motor protein MotB [Deltaproteobacteria bacterium]